MNPNQIENYLGILKIRQGGQRRVIYILGGVFILSFLFLFTLGMLDRLSGRSLYLSASIIMVFGFSYIVSWVRLEIIKGSIELIENLLLAHNR